MLSEKERLMLVEKKEEIRRLSNEIIENLYGNQDRVLIKTRVNSILSLLSTIASYSQSKSHKLNEFSKFTMHLTLLINQGASMQTPLELWCQMVNSIQFNFTDKKAIINFPKLEFNLLKNSLSAYKGTLDV